MMSAFGNLVSNCTIDDQIQTGAVTIVQLIMENTDDRMMQYTQPDFFNQCGKLISQEFTINAYVA